MKSCLLVALTTLGLLSAPLAIAQSPSLDSSESAFKALFKELVETNTTHSSGDCTLAASRLATHLKAGGFSDSELNVFSPPDHPKEGGLIATLKGSEPSAKAILLLAHLDVVEAKREDWTRDPFTLIEENGEFYGRGTVDDKSMAAIFTDLLIRYRGEHYVPKRTIKLALTCGEEGGGSVFNGARWLAETHKDWIDAEFAINEGGGGRLGDNGKPYILSVEAAEKVFQNYSLVTTGPGGHSSIPSPENPTWVMMDALKKLQAYEFPVEFTPVTREFFTRKGGIAAMMINGLLKNPNNKMADQAISGDKTLHAMLHTTCIPTLIDGGHAANAVPQRVHVNINCRIIPGHSVESIRQVLVDTINDPKVSVTIEEPLSPATAAPSLNDKIVTPVETIAAQEFPGLPVMPIMTPGATDGVFLTAAGIATYGIDAVFTDSNGNGIHGLNEHVKVQSLLDDRKFHYALIKLYADQ